MWESNSHKRTIGAALGIVLGCCILSYISVRYRRRMQVARLMELRLRSKTGTHRGIDKILPLSLLFLEKGCAKSLKLRIEGAPTSRPIPISQQSGRKGVSNSTSPEKTLVRFGFDLNVSVGYLAMNVAGSFTREAATYRFPIELKRYVHVDGCSITIVAEDLGNVEGNMATEAYKAKCIARVQEEAAQQQTYFKIQYDTSASKIVTTIMERYVCFYLGPAPVVVTTFFLVHNHVAYIIQLQSHLDNYRARLTEFFITVQSARLEKAPRVVPGRVCHTLRSGIGEEVYRVCLSPQFIVTSTNVNDALVLSYRHANEWSGEVLTWDPQKKKTSGNKFNQSTDASCDGGDVITLIPGKLYLASRWNSRAKLGATVINEVKNLLEAVSVSSGEVTGKHLPPSLYVSEALEMQLPSIQRFTTNVCIHTVDPFISMFVRTKDAGMFEFEVGAFGERELGELERTGLKGLGKLIFSRREETASGKSKVVFVVKTEKKTMLRLDAVHCPGDDLWYALKCLYVDENEVPEELLQYMEAALDTLLFIDPAYISHPPCLSANCEGH
ncbi:hypothetical protein TraAM80_04332 [Trypanosoma rangeli]|uniref:Uncharacterized protein n=1 Tax=Trypanosoma rangeli TaxID=5698 RepID=A0A422NKE7_TRYRA|nr:uncharacterized protein TraAM80_04332 [Trypanosoma rangeli]RNF05799.1 hypothetical protein TraAM80_04332 [Trypanosoma rangeli]|eukprot:RNF05799.1 hypothetical protein TraAM80_04332 [Trypanosoma rangeli]